MLKLSSHGALEVSELVEELPLEGRACPVVKASLHPYNSFCSKPERVLAKEMLSKASPRASEHHFTGSTRSF